MEVDLAFLKSSKGLLKIAEMVCVFVAFVCYAVASRPPYIAATCMEFFITFGFLLLYLLKLNKLITFFFWPLIDVFNSVFAAALMCILSLVAVSTYTVKGTLGGGVRMYILHTIPGTLLSIVNHCGLCGCSLLVFGWLYPFQKNHIQQASNHHRGPNREKLKLWKISSLIL